MSTQYKKLLNVVLDLETLDAAPTAAIIQIGACVPKFDHNLLIGHVEKEFSATISYESCLEFVLDHKLVTMSNATMLWWGKQKSRKDVFSGQEDYPSVLCRFSSWLDKLNQFSHFKNRIALWGNGADFDNVILKHSMEIFNIPISLDFRCNRCFRTMKNVFLREQDPPMEHDIELGEIKHTAIGDARFEARCLERIVEISGVIL